VKGWSKSTSFRQLLKILKILNLAAKCRWLLFFSTRSNLTVPEVQLALSLSLPLLLSLLHVIHVPLSRSLHAIKKRFCCCLFLLLYVQTPQFYICVHVCAKCSHDCVSPLFLSKCVCVLCVCIRNAYDKRILSSAVT